MTQPQKIYCRTFNSKMSSKEREALMSSTVDDDNLRVREEDEAEYLWNYRPNRQFWFKCYPGVTKINIIGAYWAMSISSGAMNYMLFVLIFFL